MEGGEPSLKILAPYTLSQGKLQPEWRALQDISNDSFVCYQDLSEYVGLENIKQGYHSELALKKHYRT